jgi:hypothetical protein
MIGLNRFTRLSILLALVGTGCPLDPKTVGEETGAGSEGDDGSATTDGGDGDDDDPSASTSSNGDDGSDDGEWDDCADRACGESCYVCDPDDPQCGLPGTLTVCTPAGTCEIWPQWDVDPCPGTGVESDVESTLTNVGGCFDVTVYATNEDLDVALHVRALGVAAEAQKSGEPVVRAYAADDPELLLELTAGSNLLAETCTDFVEDPPTIVERWRPRFWEEQGPGTVSIRVEMVSTENGDVPLADITLTDVNFGRLDYDGLDPDIQIEALTFEDVDVHHQP